MRFESTHDDDDDDDDDDDRRLQVDADNPAGRNSNSRTCTMMLHDDSPDISEAAEVKRGQWRWTYENVLVGSVFGVGFHNLGKFPELTMKNGGSCFLLAYSILAIILGIPLLFLEMSLGQLQRGNCWTVWQIAPLFQGIGLAMVLLSAFLSLYHSALLATSILYLFLSGSTQPWKNCPLPQANMTCISLDQLETRRATANESIAYLLGQHSSVHYWKQDLWGISSGMGDVGSSRPSLVGCLFLIWVISALAICKGIASLRKVMYALSIFPHLFFLILLFCLATKPGGLDGLDDYLKPSWNVFTNYDVWPVAGQEVLHSLGLCWGVHITLATYRKDNHREKLRRDAVLVMLANIIGSLCPGFVVAASLGILGKALSLEVVELIGSGSEVIFISFPAAASVTGTPSLYTVLFFLSTTMQGLATQICLLQTISAVIWDKTCCIHNKTNQFKWMKKTFVVPAALAALGFLLSLLLTTQAGIYWITFLETYTLIISVPFLALMMCVAILLVGDFRLYLENAGIKIKKNVFWFFIICLFSLTLLLALFILLDACVHFSLPSNNMPGFPPWEPVLGVPVLILAPLCVIGYAAYHLAFQQEGHIMQRCRDAGRPTRCQSPYDTEMVDCNQNPVQEPFIREDDSV